MAKSIFRIFLSLVLSYLSVGVTAKLNFKETHFDVDVRLKQLNKPAVKTIQSEDGDIIDCVDIYKQPAFDHPALKNHVIQMKPNFDFKEEKLSTKSDSSKLAVFQTWQKSGSCPEGTIPIRRIKKQDLLRADSLDQFGRKPREIISKSNATYQTNSQLPVINNTKLSMPVIVNRSAATLVTVGFNYIGAKGDINVWNPNVEAYDEFTTAQIWLKAGPGDNFESIEAGWMVNPRLYDDKRTRFFAHWTKDSYKSTGCFDLTCSGFVQTSSQVALGATIEPVSSDSGQQYDITVGIFMDPQTSNWWLKFGNDIPVGYWPASSLLFYLNHSSTLVEWGGQVYSPNVKKKPHTRTAMGSGDFARGLRGNACFIDNIRIVDFSLALKYPQWVGTWADEFYCYTAYNYQEKYGVLPIFYFGGPVFRLIETSGVPNMTKKRKLSKRNCSDSKNSKRGFTENEFYQPDPQTSNWWLKLGDIPIGYWPASSIMSSMGHAATYIEWGGQVYGSNVKKRPHTATDMGSGQFASNSYTGACYIDNIRIVEYNTFVVKYPDNVDIWADGSGDSSIFYFGGPGWSYTCP